MQGKIKVNQLKYTGNGTYDIADRTVSIDDITSIKEFINHRKYKVYRFVMKNGEKFAAIMNPRTPVSY